MDTPHTSLTVSAVLPREQRLRARPQATKGARADTADAAAAQAACTRRRLGAPVLVVERERLGPGVVVGGGMRISG